VYTRDNEKVAFIATYLADVSFADLQRLMRQHGIRFTVPLGKFMWDSQLNWTKESVLKERLAAQSSTVIDQLYNYVRTAP
jgi:hypothetical protein